MEGTEHNQWVVIDYADIVVHLFYGPVRDYYQLETLWADAPAVASEPPDANERYPDPYDS